MPSPEDVGNPKLIDIAEARDRREKNVLGHRTIDVAQLDIDGALYEVLSRWLNEIVAKPSDAVVNASLSIVNGVLELMGRDRALERPRANEAIATLIIMMAAARSTAIELIPEALRRCFEGCETCQSLNPRYTAKSPYYGRLGGENSPTLDTLCGECQPIYKGLDACAREMSALSHSNRVSDEAVKAARDAFFVENAEYSNEETRMRRAVEAAVRVLKAE